MTKRADLLRILSALPEVGKVGWNMTKRADLPPILTSGSQYKSFLVCPRKRWLEYEVPTGQFRDEGQEEAGEELKGFEPISIAIPLATGIWCHKIVQGLFREAIGLPEDLGLSHVRKIAPGVIQASRMGYLEEVASRGLDAEGESLEKTQVAQEQAALIEAFGWAFLRIRVPKLLKLYEVVSCEKEEFTLLASDVGLLGRIDLVLRRREDQKLFVWNLKTSGALSDPRWQAQWQVDQQLGLECLAVSRRLGEEVYGCFIEGFDKGPRVKVDERLIEVRGEMKETIGKIQRSRLLYGYKCEANPPLQKASYDWEGTTKKGWKKFRVWEEQFDSYGTIVQSPPISAIEWWVNWLPEEVIEGFFVTLEPIRFQAAVTQSLLRFRR